jgi:hypothetical protein
MSNINLPRVSPAKPQPSFLGHRKLLIAAALVVAGAAVVGGRAISRRTLPEPPARSSAR